MTTYTPEQSELGKKTTYEATYNPNKLHPIPRDNKRAELGVTTANLPFFGYDFWNHYEVSWLNPKGKPIVAIAELVFNCASPNLIESKSMKLYFNSFNGTKFRDENAVAEVIKRDLEQRVSSNVAINIIPLTHIKEQIVPSSFESHCIDHLDVTCDHYTVDSSLLQIEEQFVKETLYSDLLKSNCLVTGQPDWGSIEICYEGKKINHESLLKYIVSFREHTEFGEHCVERIFMDIMKQCAPQKLTIHGRYTRRGGIDINSVRSTHELVVIPKNVRLCRQ